MRARRRCIQWFKDTNLKANHNCAREARSLRIAVFNGSKILIWKQITTWLILLIHLSCCIQWFKDTNLKANHNVQVTENVRLFAVFNGSKILIWKQITTVWLIRFSMLGCIQWFKDTNLKANHNYVASYVNSNVAVFNGSKILIWKQITTAFICLCFASRLYSMVQRY